MTLGVLNITFMRPGYQAAIFAISASKHGGQLLMNLSFIKKTSLQEQDILTPTIIAAWGFAV